MNNERQDIDRLSKELLKKSIVRPDSSDFSEQLMKKVFLAPSPGKWKTNRGIIRKAWFFFVIAVICLLTTAAIVGKFSEGYYEHFNIPLTITINYVFYGGMALSILLLLYYFDSLLQFVVSNSKKNWSVS